MGQAEYDQSYFIRVDADDFPYVFGQTESAWTISPGCYGIANSGQYLRKYTEEERIWYFKKLGEPQTFSGVKKFSTVQNEDLLSAIQVEEMGKVAIQFSHLKNIEFRIFHSIEEAMLWSK